MRRERKRKKRPKKRPRRRDDGLTKERDLVALLREIGCRIEQSPELDGVYKIDAYIRGIDGLDGPLHPIGVQITKSRDNRSKLAAWLRETGKGPKPGPRLYAIIVGDVTRPMAEALRAAFISIWLKRPRGRRYHGIVIWSTGRHKWFSPRHELENPPKRTRKRRG